MIHHSLDAPYQSVETFPQVVSGSFFQKLRPKVLHAFYLQIRCQAAPFE
jgi:hypothetical protein